MAAGVNGVQRHRVTQVSVRLPAALKQVLLDEHEAVKKGLRLPAVPRKPSVSEILQQYVEESRASGQVVDAQEQVWPSVFCLPFTKTPPPPPAQFQVSKSVHSTPWYRSIKLSMPSTALTPAESTAQVMPSAE